MRREEEKRQDVGSVARADDTIRLEVGLPLMDMLATQDKLAGLVRSLASSLDPEIFEAYMHQAAVAYSLRFSEPNSAVNTLPSEIMIAFLLFQKVIGQGEVRATRRG